jgi:hypothetical protein
MEKNVLIQEPPVIKESLSESYLLRKRFKIIDESIENFVFKIAANQEELESAYCLNYKIYVKQGYMNQTSSKMRINHFNAMPYTQTFIGIQNNRTVMTISLFPDSQLGIPMDRLYKKEIDKLREKGRYVAEVGSLVSEINNQSTLMHLIKILFLYAQEYIYVDDLVVTVHPKHKNFYKVILCFEEISTMKTYSYVNDNPAIAFRMDMHKVREYYWNAYPREPVENDFYNFIFVKNSTSIILPGNKSPLYVWNTNLFNYFFKEKTDLYFEADHKTREIMHKYYHE